MLWLPADSDVVSVTLPLLHVPVPRVLDPSLNVTVPVGLGLNPANVAVNVTLCPILLGLNELARVVVMVLRVEPYS